MSKNTYFVLQAWRNVESDDLLEKKEYLQGMNGRELSEH